MTVSRIGTDTDGDSTNTGTAISFSHTVPSGASLLLLAIHMEGNETVDVVPTWDGDNFTLIRATALVANSDFRSFLYGFVAPAAKTATIAATVSDSLFRGVAAINFAGTVTTSVAAAVVFLSEDSNTANTSTNVHASAGSSPNALFVTAGWRGGDITPSTVSDSFLEIYDRATGTSATSDCSHTASWLQDGAPSAVTITMGGSDQNAGIFVELVAAAVVSGRIMSSLAGTGGLAGPGGIAGRGGGLAG